MKHRERTQKFRETGNRKHFYIHQLGKTCFAHNTGYSDSKDLAKRTISDKILKNRTYEIASDHKYNGYQRVLASVVYKFYDKKTRSGMSVNEQLAKELHKPLIKKFKRRKVYVRFKDNIWGVDLAKMGSLAFRNKNIKYFLCIVDVFTKYINASIEILIESNCKPSKLWIDQEREFYKKLMQKWFDKNDVLIYSTHNEGKSVIAERFIKTLKAKIHKKWQLIIAILS